jgi:hypothetical protein
MTTRIERSDMTQDFGTLLEATLTQDTLLEPVAGEQARKPDRQSGKIGWAILWLLGIPLPVLIILYLIWGR